MHLLIIAIVILVLFGSRKLPGAVLHDPADGVGPAAGQSRWGY